MWSAKFWSFCSTALEVPIGEIETDGWESADRSASGMAFDAVRLSLFAQPSPVSISKGTISWVRFLQRLWVCDIWKSYSSMGTRYLASCPQNCSSDGSAELFGYMGTRI